LPVVAYEGCPDRLREVLGEVGRDLAQHRERDGADAVVALDLARLAGALVLDGDDDAVVVLADLLHLVAVVDVVPTWRSKPLAIASMPPTGSNIVFFCVCASTARKPLITLLRSRSLKSCGSDGTPGFMPAPGSSS
jgi:hypothetical protein